MPKIGNGWVFLKNPDAICGILRILVVEMGSVVGIEVFVQSNIMVT